MDPTNTLRSTLPSLLTQPFASQVTRRSSMNVALAVAGMSIAATIATGIAMNRRNTFTNFFPLFGEFI